MHIPKTLITTALVAVALGLGSPAMAQHHRGGGGGEIVATAQVEAPKAARSPRRVPRRHRRRGPLRRLQPAPAQRADNGYRRDSGARPAPGVSNNGYNGNSGYNGNNGYRGKRATESGLCGSARLRKRAGRRSIPLQRNRNYAYGNSGSHNNYAYHNGHGYRYHAPFVSTARNHSFRPRLSLGFGIWVGYPVPYATRITIPSTTPPYYAYPSPGYPSTPYPQSPYPRSAVAVSAGSAVAVSADRTGSDSIDVQPGPRRTPAG